MFGKKAPPVLIGDRFIKTGGPQKVWTVMKICNSHARLVSKQLSPEQITISVNALADRALFQPLVPEMTGSEMTGSEMTGPEMTGEVPTAAADATKRAVLAQ